MMTNIIPKIAVKRTCAPRPPTIRSTPMGLSANMAAKEPPHPINAMQIKSPKMKMKGYARGLIWANLVP